MAGRAFGSLPVPDPTAAGKKTGRPLGQVIRESDEVIEQLFGGVDLTLGTGGVNKLSLVRDFTYKRMQLTV
jgi:hypothetical protein